MISKYDVIRAFEMADKKGEKLAMCLSEDKNSLLETETGEYVCSMNTYLDYMRKELHCDFECIYHEHASLTTVYRCKECGAVIFSGDDERYDPNLKCPVCAGYNHGDFWTKEEIEADEKKQKEIQFYIDYMEEQEEDYKRRQARGGKYDWEIWEKKIYGEKHCFTFELTDFGRRLAPSKLNPNYKRPWYMYNLELKIGVGDKDGMGYSMNKYYRIPLAPYSFYIQFVYPYSKKCPPDLRKYYWWQKRPIDDKDKDTVAI